jgi:excisionase family DNA binding protein
VSDLREKIRRSEADMDASHATGQFAEPLWTAEEAAAFLEVPLAMVNKLRRTGALPAVRLGALFRFEPGAVRAFARAERRGWRVR